MIDARRPEDQVLEHVTQRIVEHLRPRRIVLFGQPRARRRQGGRRPWGLDVLVYTPEEGRRWKDDVGMVLDAQAAIEAATVVRDAVFPRVEPVIARPARA